MNSQTSNIIFSLLIFLVIVGLPDKSQSNISNTTTVSYNSLGFQLVTQGVIDTTENIYESTNQLQIYADSIDYDADENLIAKGNVKLISNYNVLTSSIAIINEKQKIIILPKDFEYKDDTNYYFGSSGTLSTDFKTGKINDYKMILSDGSRIVGKTAHKKGHLDLINKGVFSPCKSKIKISNFICPIWQLEAEKFLHDNEALFIHQKHAKLRILNVPVLYFPYFASPSPLRKKRKSGFLKPALVFNFFDTQTSQSTSFPYYFAIDEDKELLLTPTINYGGGVDASQNIKWEYDQLISGGTLSIDGSTDTNFEEKNNESWLRDASLSLNFSKNLNEQYNMSFSSALQTSGTYLRRTDPYNPLNRLNTLNTSISLAGYEVFEPNDNLGISVSGYQIVKKEDNKFTPTSFPYITYNLGKKKYHNTSLYNNLILYNIFRDSGTGDLAQKQQKISYSLSSNATKIYYPIFSQIIFKTQIYSQFYNIENKKIDDDNFSGTYSRIFPMAGLLFHTPMVNKKYDIYINPKLFFVFNSRQSNSNKISNEDSSDYKYSLLNFDTLNRYTGSDKLDNSRRMSYGIDIYKNKFKLTLGQSYELEVDDNEFSRNVGLKDYMSDILGESSYTGINNEIKYDFRFNVDQGKYNYQRIGYTNKNSTGTIGMTYSETKKEVNSFLETGSKILSLGYSSYPILKYSTVNLGATFDLLADDPTAYNFGYNFYDECFGVNLNFARSFYDDRDLKPKDTLTLMFSFKYLGSYQSTNLAVSEEGKQDIKWKYNEVGPESFY